MLAHDSSPVRPEELLAHAAWLRQLALGLVRGAADPEDLVQATYLAALRSPPERDLPIRRWLAQVLRNVWKMRVRSSTRRASRETEFAAVEYAEGATSPEALLARFQTQHLLGSLVAELEEPYRSTVLLRYQEGLSSAEIARTQNVPPGTVRWRLMTGLEKLREALDSKTEGDRRAWIAMLIPFGKPLKAAAVKGASVKVYATAAAALALAGSMAVVGLGRSGASHAPQGAPRAAEAPMEHMQEMDYWSFLTEENHGGGFNRLDEPNAEFATKEGDVIIYVYTEDIDANLAEAEKLGGSIIKGRTEIPGMGWYAHFRDVGGNRVGLFQGGDMEQSQSTTA
jgi:RNA polymerase sigma factor (sigma-70 family)